MRIFFYGLFMDCTLLQEMGFHPTTVGPAQLAGFRLAIGDRATLIPAAGSTCYGILIDLPDDEAAALYSGPGVADYRPETVQAILLQDRSMWDSVCYNLPVPASGTARNDEYAEALARLAEKLEFPTDYVREIRNC